MTFSILAERDALDVQPAQLCIDGAWRDGQLPPFEHHHPATNELVTTVATASAADVDAAVRAARRAFDDSGWPSLAARDRRALLRRFVELVTTERDDLSRLQSLDNGAPLQHGLRNYQASGGVPAEMFEHYLGWIDKLHGETLPSYQTADLLTMTWREPIGVVAAIVPYNSPSFLWAQKVAPALCAGCTVVCKPSELAPLGVTRLVALLHEAGLPPGVVNLVHGPAEPTARALVEHPGVDMITFTGSVAVGESIARAAAVGSRRSVLELGGKSATIVFPDAPDPGAAGLATAAGVSVGMSGQSCATSTRLLAHRGVYDAVLEGAARVASVVRQGSPFDLDTTSAALITDAHARRVLSIVEAGVDEGARVVVGGGRPGGDLVGGNWVEPTVFADVDPASALARTEIFGPVLSVIPFADEDEAVRLANDSTFGLAARILTADVGRGLRMARAIRAGTVGINAWELVPNAPFGGYRASGTGREGGRFGIEEFTELKTVHVAPGAVG